MFSGLPRKQPNGGRALGCQDACGVEIGAGLLSQRPGAGWIAIRDRQESHGGMLGGERARSVPIRPAPTTAMPMLFCFMRLAFEQSYY